MVAHMITVLERLTQAQNFATDYQSEQPAHRAGIIAIIRDDHIASARLYVESIESDEADIDTVVERLSGQAASVTRDLRGEETRPESRKGS